LGGGPSGSEENCQEDARRTAEFAIFVVVLFVVFQFFVFLVVTAR
jgi:hypothetical protein